MGTHLIVLSESYAMNTNMTGFGRFSINPCILVLWTNVASALEGLTLLLLTPDISGATYLACVTNTRYIRSLGTLALSKIKTK